MSESCGKCGGPFRITVIRDPCDASAVRHCRDYPEHDTGGPCLEAVLAVKERLTPDQWLSDDSNPWKAPENKIERHSL